MFNWFSEESKILSIEILVHQMSCGSQKKKHEAAEKYKLQFVLIQEKMENLKIKCPFTCKRVGVSYSRDSDWQQMELFQRVKLLLK